MTFPPISNWFEKSFDTPLIIAGPCSAENRQQVIDTALELAKLNRVHVFRAGIWKPRSRPGSFQGAGNVALEWLMEAKQLTGLKMAIEVATPQHVDFALKHGIDILWVGARTSSIPFLLTSWHTHLQVLTSPFWLKIR